MQQKHIFLSFSFLLVVCLSALGQKTRNISDSMIEQRGAFLKQRLRATDVQVDSLKALYRNFLSTMANLRRSKLDSAQYRAQFSALIQSQDAALERILSPSQLVILRKDQEAAQKRNRAILEAHQSKRSASPHIQP